jgi:hypothetical protein
VQRTLDKPHFHHKIQRTKRKDSLIRGSKKNNHKRHKEKNILHQIILLKNGHEEAQETQREK